MAFDQGAFEKSLAVIAANRQDYSSGFRPGTQTLAGRKFDEDTRQFNEKFAEDKYRDRRDFKEGVRQFDAKLAADVMGAKLKASGSGGSSGGSGGSGGLDKYSEKERSSERTNTIYSDLEATRQKYIELGSDVPFQRAVNETIQYYLGSQGSAYSGDEVLEAILRRSGELSKTDPAIKAAMDAGGNYFNTAGGKKNKWFYDMYADPNQKKNQTQATDSSGTPIRTR